RYRDAQLVCAPDAPESGGTAVLSALGMLQNVELPAPETPSDDGGDPAPESAHLISEAERLALADRSAYSADPTFVEPPEGETFSLLDPGYLAQRAALLDPEESMDSAEPGKEPATTDDKKEEGTSHISIVDGDGNMASMTTSLQSNFGSFHMAGGFFLNNHLENFATEPEKDGEPVANALAGGKRPRTAMAPTMVFSAREDGSIGTPFLATGSPGGSEITSYVVKNLVAMLDWGMDPQSAADLRNFGAVSRSEAIVESGWGATDGSDGDDLVDALDGPGPDPKESSMPSGTATILRHDGALIGGADPRREGEVRGG
ncbi:gamma-glutamyltransferase, partial [Dietzia timorensis]